MHHRIFILSRISTEIGAEILANMTNICNVFSIEKYCIYEC